MRLSNLKKNQKPLRMHYLLSKSEDTIKSFLNYLCWALHAKKTDNYVSDVEEVLKNIFGTQTNGGKMILEMLNNLVNLKQIGDDEGHHFNNIGFDCVLLPEEIEEKYQKIKANPNCRVKSCDCITLLLSIKKINDSPEDLTKIKYDFFDKLFKIQEVRDWANNKSQVMNILNLYGN